MKLILIPLLTTLLTILISLRAIIWFLDYNQIYAEEYLSAEDKYLLSLPTSDASVNSCNYQFNLPPSVINGQFVGTVIASDPDPGQTITFAIVEGNTNYKAFRIDAATGDLFINNATFINARKKLEFFLTVRVTDSGARNHNGKIVKLSAQAIIHITRTQ